MHIENEVKYDFSDVLIKPKRSYYTSRKEVDLERVFKFKWSNLSWKGIPIVASNMDTVGTIGSAEVLSKHKVLTCLHKFHTVDELLKISSGIKKNVAITTGVAEGLQTLYDLGGQIKNFNFLCIDVANGYTEQFCDFIKLARSEFANKIIIAGNVCTPEMTEQLILSGADIVKVGIGPGSVCTTRIQTGVGYPQLSAVIECADAAHGLGAHIIADGGCTCPGDVAKGFGGGADFVMLGGMFAGHDEGKGKLIKSNGKKYIEFYGSSSDVANKKHYGGLSDYRSSEGKTVQIKYRGKIRDTIFNILGGVRSSCTYVGAPSLKQLSKCTTFVRVSNQYNNTFVK